MPGKLSHSIAFDQVVEHGMGLVIGEPAIEAGRAFALGEACLAGIAIEQADVVPLAVALTDGEIAGVTSPVEGTRVVLATEASEVVRGRESSRRWGLVVVQRIG